MASAVAQWPAVKMVESTAHFVRQGQPVQVAHAPVNGWVQQLEIAENADDRFLRRWRNFSGRSSRAPKIGGSRLGRWLEERRWYCKYAWFHRQLNSVLRKKKWR